MDASPLLNGPLAATFGCHSSCSVAANPVVGPPLVLETSRQEPDGHRRLQTEISRASPQLNLGAAVIAEVVRRAVQSVTMGNVIQAGNRMNPARHAAIGGGLPDENVETTIYICRR